MTDMLTWTGWRAAVAVGTCAGIIGVVVHACGGPLWLCMVASGVWGWLAPWRIRRVTR